MLGRSVREFVGSLTASRIIEYRRWHPNSARFALEAVKRIDALLDIERGINGKTVGERLALRKEFGAVVLIDLREWMTAERRKLSRHAPMAKAMPWAGSHGYSPASTAGACTRRRCTRRSAGRRDWTCSHARHARHTRREGSAERGVTIEGAPQRSHSAAREAG